MNTMKKELVELQTQPMSIKMRNFLDCLAFLLKHLRFPKLRTLTIRKKQLHLLINCLRESIFRFSFNSSSRMVKRKVKVKKEKKPSEYQHGFPCLAKMKGHPWWPSRIDFVRPSQCLHRKQGAVLMAERDFK